MEIKNNHIEHATLTLLLTFTRAIGRTPPTIWIWRQIGMLDGIINIEGRSCITAAGVEKFNQRAIAGEFSRPTYAPKRGVK